ncbi:hypothetical protein UA08_04456 [Talaromyces atroroseus]|uniref:Zn(2)-C6 fungal-type domain-containing protein n=1 Tax=Talaromyces atroroseus TaxID=1441469 RepID=A0A1Q5Q8D2_TALAT|nr:hypothetical protein UA08_04456 [Talaromyces atroroseus]OKL60322.1 hypothetical protein UA08_04456 [Talaromyces atroroseus]
MVNVAGRSKGCSTCRKRRIKCGVKDITFIKGTIVKSRRSEKRTNESAKYGVKDADSTECQVPRFASLKGDDSEIYVCYARKYLRQGAPLDLALQRIRLDDITSARMNTTNDHLFHQAFLSFAILVYGTQYRETPIIEKGYAIYGEALKKLNHALSDPECYTRDDVILSVIAFSMLACIVPTSAGQYLKHMMGLQTLLGLRDPRSSCFLGSTGSYKAVRHMMLFASLRTAKPSILARAEWKAVLRANCSAKEIQEQELFDVLADCSIINAQRDGMLIKRRLEPECSAGERGEAREKALILLTRLHDWRKKWDDDERNSHTELSMPLAMQQSKQDSLRNNLSTCPFLTVLAFSDESTVTMFMFYNTALIYIFRVLANLAVQSFGAQFDQSFTKNRLHAGSQGDSWETPRDKYNTAEQLAALNIYRSLPNYLVQMSSTSTNTTPIVHWAISTAWVTLGGHESAYGRWLKELLNAEGQDVVAQGLWNI